MVEDQEDQKEAVLPWRPIQLEGLQYSSSDRLQKKKEAEDLVQKREPHARVSHTHFCILYICIYIRGTFVAMKCGHLTFPL